VAGASGCPFLEGKRRWCARAWNALRPGSADRELARELDAHLSLIEDEYRRRGLPADAARRGARLALGGVEQTKEQHRDARAFRWLDNLRRDAVYAMRMLRRHPVATTTSTLSLAIGILASMVLPQATYPCAGATWRSGWPWADRAARLSGPWSGRARPFWEREPRSESSAP
jgi:hypothetical protein